MPASVRDASRDREPRHQHSFSESGRVSVPMWDSSDPDRCPPPLPIPPGSASLQTKPNTSAAIQAAANKLHERARENLGAAYLASISPSSSPEKSLIKGAAHRRMQSAHASNGKDLKSYLDGVRSGSPERAADYSPSRPETPTRTSLRPILGENTPPSATMRALQTMAAKEEVPLTDITNGKAAHSNDDVHAQLSKLTNIATNLQQEMASLSRRSKDNAADLLGLREAAKTRDDDIRKNLRDLMSSPTFLTSTSPHLNASTGFGLGLGLLDSKAFGSPPPLPRAASHNNILDADRMASTSPFSVEGAASVAMLEKIIREMVTREGQERLLSNLSELMDKSSKMSSEAVIKVNELSEFIKDQSKGQKRSDGGQALVRSQQSEAIPGDLNAILTRIKDSVASNGGLTAEVKALVRELRGEILGMGRELGRKLDEANASPTELSRSGDPPADMQVIVSHSINELRDHMEALIHDSARQSSALIQSRNEPSTDDLYAVVKHALSEHGDALTQSRGQMDVDKEELLSAVRAACDNFKPEIELQQYGLERDEILDVLKEGLNDYRSSIDAATAGSVDKQEVFNAMQEALQAVELPQPVLDTHALRAEMLASIRECLEEFKSTAVPPSSSILEDESTREMISDAVRSGLTEHADSSARVMEISRDDLFDAVKAGLDGSSIPFGGFGEQVLQQLHELVDNMKVEFKQYSAANGRDTEQVLDAIKDGLEVLRTQIESYVDRAQDVTGQTETFDAVRTSLDSLREDVKSAVEGGPATGKKDLLDYIKSEFEHLHIVIGNTPLDSRDGSDKQEILEAIDSMRSELGVGTTSSGLDNTSLDNIKEDLAHLRNALAPIMIKIGAGTADQDEVLASLREAIAAMPSQPADGISTEVLEAIRGEFENLQSTISRTGGNRADMEEMLDTIRLGLDDLRTHVDKKLENPEKHILSGEILDTLSEGLETLRLDITKTLEKPVDMTVSYEILDTLKEGLAALRADIEKRLPQTERGQISEDGQIVLADVAGGVRGEAQAGSSQPTAKAKDDLDRVEVMLAQLQIKIEALDRTVQDMPSGTAAQGESVTKEHLSVVEDSIREMQTTLAELLSKERQEIENAATKSDTDAIETLLRNTKSQIEELNIAQGDNIATREQVEAVEAVTRVAKDAIDALAVSVEESVATKADVAVVEVLASDVKSALEEFLAKTQGLGEGEVAQRLTKADLDVLGVVCTEIKEKLLEMVLPDVETLPAKADIEQLHGLINDLREGHEKFRETYDKDIGVTAQAFDDRRKDTEEIVGSVTEIKGLLDTLKQDATDRSESHTTSLEGVSAALTVIQEKVEANPAVADDVKAIIESVKNEFERAHASLEAIQTTHYEHHTVGLDKQAEHMEAILSGLAEQFDPRLDDLVAKLDVVQTAAEEKSAAQEAILSSTKELADELKLSIDTLGTALTSSTAGFNDATEKLSQDSKTVFDRVDDVYNKLDETNSGVKGEHEITRGEIAKTLEAVAGVQGDLLEHNPQILISLKELQALISQHYEQSQKTAADHAETLQGMTEASKAHAEELKSSFIAAQSAQGTDPVLLEKLEQLSSADTQPTLQIERLDAIHAQMMATAAEVTAFVATQTQRIADEHSSREQEAEELALVIGKHQTKKEHLEDDISVLNSEKSDLQSTVKSLHTEQQSLTSQNARLAADIQALNAALASRKQELSAMEAKADALEKRVLEGLTSHSRARNFLSKPPRAPASPRRPKGRDLRIPSDTSEVSSLPASSVAAPRMSMARSPATTTPQPERRIMSLSQMHLNAGTRGPAASPDRTAPRTSSFGTPGRKTSWPAAKRMLDIAEDKENAGDSRPSSRGSESSAGNCSVTDSAVASLVAAKVRRRIEEGALDTDSGLGSELPTALVLADGGRGQGGEYFD